jgi:hypothetical protein
LADAGVPRGSVGDFGCEGDVFAEKYRRNVGVEGDGDGDGAGEEEEEEDGATTL